MSAGSCVYRRIDTPGRSHHRSGEANPGRPSYYAVRFTTRVLHVQSKPTPVIEKSVEGVIPHGWVHARHCVFGAGGCLSWRVL